MLPMVRVLPPGVVLRFALPVYSPTTWKSPLSVASKAFPLTFARPPPFILSLISTVLVLHTSMTGFFVILVHADLHLKHSYFPLCLVSDHFSPFTQTISLKALLRVRSHDFQYCHLHSTSSFSPSLHCNALVLSPSPPLQSLSAVHQLDSTALAPPPLNLFISTSLKILLSSPILPRWSTRQGKTIACLSSTSIVCPSITISGRICSKESLSSTWGSSS